MALGSVRTKIVKNRSNMSGFLTTYQNFNRFCQDFPNIPQMTLILSLGPFSNAFFTLIYNENLNVTI
jgi:hypothetical protein